MSKAGEPAAALVALRRIIRFLRLAEREAEASYGLSAAQLFVLHSLADAPAGSVSELARRTLTDQSSVSTVVSRLESKRLLVRAVARADRRRVEIRLTTAGRRIVVKRPDPPQPKIIAAIESMAPAKRRELVRALENLVTAIGAADVEPLMLFEDDAPRRRRSK